MARLEIVNRDTNDRRAGTHVPKLDGPSRCQYAMPVKNKVRTIQLSQVYIPEGTGF